jgi:serine/threonine protein kinase
MSPEIVQRKEYNGTESDVWSLGVLTFAILTGSYPFKAETERDLYQKIGKGVFNVPDYISPLGKAFIKRMLTLDPAKRILTSDVKNPL